MEDFGFLFTDPEPLIFFLTMSLWSSKSMYFFYKTPWVSATLPWLIKCPLILPRLTFWASFLMVARRFAEYNIKMLFQWKVDTSFPNYDQQRRFIISVQQKLPDKKVLLTNGESTITEQENRINIEMQARKQILFVKLSATSALVQSCTLSMSVLTFSVLVFTQTLCTPHIPHLTILSPCTNLNSSVLAIPKPLHFPTIPER